MRAVCDNVLMYEGDGTDELLEELSLLFVKAGSDYIKSEMNIDEGERTRLLIDVGEMFLSRLLSVYPTVQPLDDIEEVIDHLINNLQEQRLLLIRRQYMAVS